MSMQNWSDEMILVELPAEPETTDELERVVRAVRDRGDCGVVVDLSGVTVLTSTSLAALLRLKKLLDDCGRPLQLCSVGRATQGIISLTGLDEVFEMVGDRFDALARAEAAPGVAPAPKAV
jgi:anti-anti-sigma factor